MKALIFALTFAFASFADTITVPVSPPESAPPSSNCDDELNRAKRYECFRAQRKGPEYRATMDSESPLAQWDTVTTISIQGEDTTKTITIKRAENWDSSRKDFTRFVDMYILLGVLNIIGTTILVLASLAN